MTVTALDTKRQRGRCKAKVASGGQCLRSPQWDGLCFQHWKMALRLGLVERR